MILGRSMKRIVLVVVFLSSLAFAQAPVKKPADSQSTAAQPAATAGLSEATVNEFIRNTFGYDENIKWRVVDIKPAQDPSLTEVSVMMNTPQGQQLLKFFVTPDQKSAISGEFMPFGADPYAGARQQLQTSVNGPVRGPADAAVTIVEFGDLQCPACKKAQPIIDKLLTEVPSAKLVFQQFPLTQIHKWAMTAAKYGLCVAKQNNDAYWKFVEVVYSHQDELQPMSEEQVTPKLKEYAVEAGVDGEKVQACSSDPDIGAKVQTSIALGNAMGITGTPTLFIGGRKIANVGGTPYEILKGITEFQAGKK